MILRDAAWCCVVMRDAARACVPAFVLRVMSNVVISI